MYNIHNKYLKSHTLKLTSIGLSNPSYTLMAINNKKLEKIIRDICFKWINLFLKCKLK